MTKREIYDPETRSKWDNSIFNKLVTSEFYKKASVIFIFVSFELEPLEKCPKIDSKNIDLIIMPGVAFDRHGGRIGYGAGFYDRFLNKMNRKVDKIAIDYNFQVLDEVPMNELDEPIDGIITEEEISLFMKQAFL